MVKFVRRQYVHFGHTEVVVYVLILGVDDDLRVSYGVYAFLVDPGVERRHVDVLDLFSLSHVGHVM